MRNSFWDELDYLLYFRGHFWDLAGDSNVTSLSFVKGIEPPSVWGLSIAM